ncbi:MAG: hypothetical protein EA413_13580 [Cyanobium sp. PLM2.Bin73]|nr:MAG: hypothetical protein EA413_13580 [Cyanobium sp. PLM2.Bin73]
MAGLLCLPALPVYAALPSGTVEAPAQAPAATLEAEGELIAKKTGGKKGGSARKSSKGKSGFKSSSSSMSKGSKKPQGGWKKTSNEKNTPSLNSKSSKNNTKNKASSKNKTSNKTTTAKKNDRRDQKLDKREKQADRRDDRLDKRDKNLDKRADRIDKKWDKRYDRWDDRWDRYPGWARPGWGYARPWNYGWYDSGYRSSNWGWYGASAAAWGLTTLTTAAIINSAVDNAVSNQTTYVVVPNTDYRLLYGTVEPINDQSVRFAVEAGSSETYFDADCNRGTLNGRNPTSASEAELLNAACQVAFGAV